MAHPNEELLRKGYDAFSKGDMDTVSSLFADDIVWHVPGRSALAGDYKGKEEVFGFFGKLMEMTEGTFQTELHDILANDEHAVVLVKSRAKRGDVTFVGNEAHVFHIKDGKTTEFWGHSADQYAADEFFS